MTATQERTTPRSAEGAGKDKGGSARPPRKRLSLPPFRLLLPYIPILIVLLLAVFAPMLAPYDPRKVVAIPQQAPGPEHWFGTDSVGMDIFSRVLAGIEISVRTSMIVAVACTVLGLLIGTFIGLAESSRGFFGLIGRGVNKVSEYILATPNLIIGIVVVGLMGATDVALMIALTLGLMQGPIRLTRTEVLKVRKDAYLDAADMAGESKLAIAIRHVLPNSMRPALVNLPLVFGNSILFLATLGFIGVGAQPPTPEWGAMISGGVSAMMLGYWWGTLFPAAALSITVLVVAYAARGIRKGWPELTHYFRLLRTSRS